MLFYERHCAPRPPLVPVLLPLRCRRRKRPVRPVPSPSVLLFVVIYRHTTERHPYPSINLSSRRNPLVFTFADCAARPRSHRHNLRQFRDRTRIVIGKLRQRERGVLQRTGVTNRFLGNTSLWATVVALAGETGYVTDEQNKGK